MRLFELIKKELSFHFKKIEKWIKLPKLSDKPLFQGDKKHLFLLGFGGLTILGVLSILLFILLTYFGAFGKIPDREELLSINNFNASEVYFEDDVLLGKYFIENRSEISIDEISPYVLNALIATEDARFMEHSGVDLRAAARVIWKSILLQKEESGGGSTISQQLAKNLYPRQRYRFFAMPINKLKEMMIARRLEKIYSKEGLLNLYLNTVPFSRNIYGIKVAANQFFSTTPEQLKAEEAAVLIGMLKGTSIYDPVRNPEQSLSRRNVVLRQMQRYEYIDKEDVDSLIQLPLTLKYNKAQKRSKAPYFQEHLKGELEDILSNIHKPTGENYGLYTDGLRIYTTINSEMQDYAEYAVNKHMTNLQKTFNKHWKGRKPWRNDAMLEREVKKSARFKNMVAKGYPDQVIDSIFQEPVSMIIFDAKKGEVTKEMSPLDSIKYYISLLHAGFLAAEPQTGKIRAWVGGLDYAYFQYDHVKSKRQVGSTFKPIVYAEAIKQGIPPCNYFQNNLVTYPDWEDWQPRNSDGQYGGFYSMSGGLSKSINTITVEVLFQTGIESVRNLAKELGIRSKIPEGPAIALGAMEGSLYEMVQVYSTLANRGKRNDLYTIERIEDNNGQVLYEHEKEKAQSIIRPEHADMMAEMLEMVVDSGTARRLRYYHGLGGEIAGKTGTTQNQSDGWFLGYKSNLVAGAWVGAESPAVRFRSLSLGQGANTALPIWGYFMQKVYKDKSFKSIRYAKFQPLTEYASEQLACDPFLSDDILDFDLLIEEENRNHPFDDLFNRNREQAFQIEDIEDGISPEELKRVEERLEQLKKKDERKKKLRNLWSDKLFGKKDKKKKQDGNQ